MATTGYFLKIEEIEGESQDAKHKGETDIDSWSWGETQSGGSGIGGGSGAGKVVMQDLHFVTKVSKASPKLFLACASGQHLSKAPFDLPQGQQRSAGVSACHSHGCAGVFL